ncbi:type II glyceraldehyde-3-phosphate dehydrogenase [Candidatus Woesearchaeota archaeon]|nr:type II glyceraldehyde-3-phosphate dehydrogenase [Candidatus Woesearchaeota archaeon]
MQKIKVAVNGRGTIGLRVADAIALQDDMELVGIAAYTPTGSDAYLFNSGALPYPLYVNNSKEFEEKGYRKIAGSIIDLLRSADVVIDCSDKKGRVNKKLYADFPQLKQVYQGGEGSSIAEVSFVAQCNYNAASGKDAVRVVSCNTTGASRVINAFKDIAIEAMLTLARRSVDPRDGNEGMTDALKLEADSHHAADIQTIFPGLQITSDAFIAPVTQMHAHMLTLDLSTDFHPTLDFILDRLQQEERLLLVKMNDGFPSTSQVRHLGTLLKRGRAGDLYETVVWQDQVRLREMRRKYNREVEMPFYRLKIPFAIHQEADVVPETVDAVRAMFSLAEQKDSIAKTNVSLGIENKVRLATLDSL